MQVYLIMAAAPSNAIDRNTSRSICDAVAERLQRDLRLDALPPSSHLEHLLETMRRQENGTARDN
jgi:hypothetical protein